MSRRTKILIVVILILIVLALLYWLFLRPRYLPPLTTPSPAANVNAAPEPPLALPAVNAPLAEVPKVSDEEKLRSDLSRLSAAFAERFGSYSNQGNFENLLDLKPLMTKKMQDGTDDFIAASREARGDTSVYFGVTTKAISTNIALLDEEGGQTTIVVRTQKREASGSMTENVRIYYQDLELVFLKLGEEWKVDEATWK
jgi:hypothetical protein